MILEVVLFCSFFYTSNNLKTFKVIKSCKTSKNYTFLKLTNFKTLTEART